GDERPRPLVVERRPGAGVVGRPALVDLDGVAVDRPILPDRPAASGGMPVAGGRADRAARVPVRAWRAPTRRATQARWEG
ncbi:MAG: hypothetical protein ACRDZR_14960, partial [Acidimicrobiales bacterium]